MMKHIQHRITLALFSALILTMVGCSHQSGKNELVIGGPAPLFSLQDQNGDVQTLESFRGQKVLVYFYPKDFTGGCTTEACSIRDNFGNYKSAGIVVLGISGDSVESHKAFEEEHGLPFTLLADVGLNVAESYGAAGMKLYASRHSFLIDVEGNLIAMMRNVDPSTHSAEVLSLFETGSPE